MINEDVDIVELYKAVKALSSLVLKIENQTNDDNDEWFDAEASNNKTILREFLIKNNE